MLLSRRVRTEPISMFRIRYRRPLSPLICRLKSILEHDSHNTISVLFSITAESDGKRSSTLQLVYDGSPRRSPKFSGARWEKHGVRVGDAVIALAIHTSSLFRFSTTLGTFECTLASSGLRDSEEGIALSCGCYGGCDGFRIDFAMRTSP